MRTGMQSQCMPKKIDVRPPRQKRDESSVRESLTSGETCSYPSGLPEALARSFPPSVDTTSRPVIDAPKAARQEVLWGRLGNVCQYDFPMSIHTPTCCIAPVSGLSNWPDFKYTQLAGSGVSIEGFRRSGVTESLKIPGGLFGAPILAQLSLILVRHPETAPVRNSNYHLVYP